VITEIAPLFQPGGLTSNGSAGTWQPTAGARATVTAGSPVWLAFDGGVVV
jgi:hypothetical protein